MGMFLLTPRSGSIHGDAGCDELTELSAAAPERFV